ncbi:HindVP family restriction endonuclease [Staphylococcus epidermidis]|uniref:HindVP family restriction endonuclease n=1 Tax=Staphylococcus epidermidis TaxID=1282 RepID=UPI00066DB54C|nr:HindVP family restriction endonuclease [Staphylococcus epidermidis]MCG7840176.1 HindVP family restriction endonuclease [Staphylococcus epidermidis]MCG7843423.1 HindVP family restriction endonuclease [Staphylococcus epidermidis]
MKPSLFGIKNSNRDLSEKEAWGKNQFNNNFPISLINYMASKKLESVYIKLSSNNTTYHDFIDIFELFGESYTNKFLYFSFETPYLPFQRFSKGSIPRADITTLLLGKNNKDDKVLSSLEIKLTALPDHTTCDLNEDEYSCEIVIRPDTIVYLAFSLVENWKDKPSELYKHLSEVEKNIKDLTDGKEVKKHFQLVLDTLDKILKLTRDNQKPLILQPVWKTIGKSPKLANNCLDSFVWSDHAFAKLFINESRHSSSNNLNRLNRTCIWLYAMLLDFSKNEMINHKNIIDTITFNTKNDKAFSLSGKKTYKYLNCNILTRPRIKIGEIQNIILGGGEKFLSPERRFDSAIVSAPGLFERNDENEKN